MMVCCTNDDQDKNVGGYVVAVLGIGEVKTGSRAPAGEAGKSEAMAFPWNLYIRGNP